MPTAIITSDLPVPIYPSCIGPFRILRDLGEGGFAKAVGAYDISTERVICLKVFRKDRLKDDCTEETLLNELDVYKRIVSSMPCPAANFIMGLELSFQTQDKICFAMDLMAGDLDSYMAKNPEYTYQHAGRWAAQVTLGLKSLHDIGIIHRDIKPANILIDVRQNVRITDFGLSYLDKDDGPLGRQAITSSAVGTRFYMAPELLYNQSKFSPMKYGTPVDWWALGCVIYELVSERHKALFTTKDDMLFYISWCSSRSRVSKVYPGLEDLEDILADLISGLLDPDPSSRSGFSEIVAHRCFLKPGGTSEFSNAYSRAREREEVPGSLPDLQYGPETHWDTELWFRGPAHVPGVDWNSAFVSHS